MTDDPARSNPLIDALLPRQMAERAEQVGADKTRLDTASLMALAVLAGSFIAFGALFSTIVSAAAEGVLPYGVIRLLSGLVFSVGLILVVAGGAELFTGNNLMVMAWASRKISLLQLLRAWTLVYVGNFAGAVATALLVFLSDQYGHGGGAVGLAALSAAQAKASLEFIPALVHGILGNVLVCLAVWLCYGARTTTDKVLAIVPPISLFVAAGFEHSVANMYLLPYGLMVKNWAGGSFWTAIGKTPEAYSDLSWQSTIGNLVPVTLGNVIGGGVLVGAVYWFIYLRKR